MKRGLALVFLVFCFSLAYAQKYWVAGAGDWGDKTHWSKTSGGIGGAAVPNSSQDAIFDVNSGIRNGDNVVVEQLSFVQDLDFSSLPFPLTLKGDSSSIFFISGKILGEDRFVNEFKGAVHMNLSLIHI